MDHRRPLRRGLAVLIVGFVALIRPTQAQPVGHPPGSVQRGEGDATAGERVYQRNCAMCHGPDAAGMMGMHPSLRGAIQRLSLEGVDVAIRKGRNTMPPMPAWEGRLSEQEIADVVAYVASLPNGPRNFGPEDGRDGMDGMMGGRETRAQDSTDDPWLLGAVVVVLGLAFVVVLLALRQRRLAAGGLEDARSVLDRRYAAGELTRDEYLERRRDLET
jgi:mono/diheme cytochrome c family protein